MQTLCHGDAKSANIMWDGTDALYYDFQWFGKAPPSKDLAYYIGINGSEPEDVLLKFYHGELASFLEQQGDEVPPYKHLFDSYCLAQADLCRWMTGGFSFGNTNLIFGHAKRVIAKLNEGRQLKTEDEY